MKYFKTRVNKQEHTENTTLGNNVKKIGKSTLRSSSDKGLPWNGVYVHLRDGTAHTYDQNI